MTSIVSDVALAVGNSMAVSIVAKVTLIMALTLVTTQMTRKSRAAVRHVLLAAAFAMSVALPLASMLVPSVPLVRVPIEAATSELPDSASHSGFTPVGIPIHALSSDRTRVLPSGVSVFLFLFAAWATGTVVFLLPMLVGLWRARTLLRSGRVWEYGQSVVQQLSGDVGLRRRVEVLLHETISGPVSCGVFQATIVLPMDAQSWSEDELRHAILHEMEHVRRADWMTQFIARAVCAGYWFHPFFWIAWRQLCLEAERACDDGVLERAEATAYADQLVALAERMSTPPKRPLLTMASGTDLARRIHAVLDRRQQRGRAGMFCLALAFAASVLLVTTISPIRIVAAAQVSASQSFAGSLRDAVGQIIPAATLTLSDVLTHRVLETQTDQAGRFTFGAIPAGEYLLQIRKVGFVAPTERIRLVAGQELRRDMVLEIGGVDETVTVLSSDASAALPPLPRPLPLSRSTPQPEMSRQEFERCAQASMFCRVTPPHKIADAQPIYPTRQRENGIAGKVTIQGRIGKDGLIKDFRNIEPADPDFTTATLDALRRWQFTATQLDGVPIEVTIRVTANFVVQ